MVAKGFRRTALWLEGNIPSCIFFLLTVYTVCLEGCLNKIADGDDCVVDNHVIQEGGNYIFPGCTISCLCIKGKLSCDTSYHCDSNEVCQQQRNGMYQCTCTPDGFELVGGVCVSICSEYEAFGTCTCETSCANPQVCIPCAQDKRCYCPNGFYLQGQDCVKEEECSCFNEGFLISNSESYLNSNCTQLCACVNDQLNCVPYQCSPDAACVHTNDVWQCICNYDYTGDGLICTRVPTIAKDCYEALEAGNRDNGVYKVLPLRWPGPPFNVYCDMTGGGWTVFQRRTDGITNFYRGWDEYKNGFGSNDQGNDFWLGNEQLHYLTNQKNYKLRIDLVTSRLERLYAEYASFVIGDEDTKYQLDVEGFSGDARDGLNLNNGKRFSTRDQDNDGCSTHNYAESHKGGWWYTDSQCGYCSSSGGNADFLCNFFEYTVGNCDETIGTSSNLNGDYQGGDGENIFWVHIAYRQCNLNSTVMRILPSSV